MVVVVGAAVQNMVFFGNQGSNNIALGFIKIQHGTHVDTRTDQYARSNPDTTAGADRMETSEKLTT